MSSVRTVKPGEPVHRIALCDLDAVIVRESDGGSWRTVSSRMTSAEAFQLAEELRAAAKYLDAKNPRKER